MRQGPGPDIELCRHGLSHYNWHFCVNPLIGLRISYKQDPARIEALRDKRARTTTVTTKGERINENNE
jgi:hypothetical protein